MNELAEFFRVGFAAGGGERHHRPFFEITRTVIIMFMTERALASFEGTYGWKVGVDGSVAIVTLGAGGAIDTENLTSPVLGFILDPAGLMYNLTLEGSKISRITR